MLTFKLVESSNRFALHVHVDYKADETLTVTRTVLYFKGTAQLL